MNDKHARPLPRVPKTAWTLFALLFAGCGTPVDADGPFATEVHGVLVERCGCHDNTQGPAAGTSSKAGPGDFAADDLSIAYDAAQDYLTPGEPENSPLYTQILPDAGGEPDMPPLAFEPIPQLERDAIRDWIADGAIAE